MANMNLTYRVTGRYMTGSTVTAYHLVGIDGSQVVANKERIIYMIGRGQIENMRLQTNGDDILLRGKGINLNNLPVYDTNKGQFRGNQASQVAASTNVNPKRNSGINPMGQLKLEKRIMYKTNCIGYIVRDLSGQEKKLSRKNVMELATQKLISNAVVQKYKPVDETEYKLILRGEGCDISKLPVVTVDQNGNIVDTSDTSNAQNYSVRAVKMRRGGILYDTEKSIKICFEPQDYLICGVSGEIKLIKMGEAESRIIVDGESRAAVCDDYLNSLHRYPIELFGSKAQVLTPEQVKRWAIVKVKIA